MAELSEARQLVKHQVKIGGMQCSFCTESIQKVLLGLEGVKKVNVSLAHEEALVQYDPSRIEPWKIDKVLRNIGYTVRDPKKVRSFEEENAELRRGRNRLLAAGSLAFVTGVLMVFARLRQPEPWFPVVMVGGALINVFIVGYPFLKMAFHSLRRGILNQHVLMEFAAFGGLAGGIAGYYLPQFAPVRSDFFAVATFVTAYHLLGGYASMRVRTKSSQAVRKLLSLQPPTARVIRDGKEAVVEIEEVAKGELVRIRPGENIPVDGIVVEGHSTVDESIVTGESMPVEKGVKGEVIGGSINLTGTLKVQVTRVGAESFLQQVARYIEEARAMKPGILQLIDRVLKYFVPTVLLFAFAAFFAWTVGAWVLFGEPDIHRAAFAALAVLVMGYPCALGMATPLAMIRGGGLAATKGILFRSSEAFHIFKDVKKIIFDKTGTITKGRPRVVEIQPLKGHGIKELLSAASSIESVSEHPLARAIVERAVEEHVKASEVTDFLNIPGKGIKAGLSGKPVVVGNVRFLAEEGIDMSQAQQTIREMEERGETVVAVSTESKLIGLIGIADQIKADAIETVGRLKEIGIESIMLTGDNERTARAVARRVGIDTVLAEVLPNEKADIIRGFQEEGERVVMVGDGINDAPALMQADIGIAIGAGTDIAIEAADIIIVGDRLGAVPDAYFIGRSSYTKTKQNLALAFSFNGIGVPAATTGLVHPIWAMIAMGVSVISVLLNSFGGQLIPKTKQRVREVRKLVLDVPSIHCEKCVATILDAVSDVEGVESVEGDQTNRMIVVTHKGGAEVEKEVRGAIVRGGHVIA
ncbi:MAG: heavy metal translocating P-type ATPase [Candidatus Hydrothermarchaeaceae archaeon]